jgi:homoserine O-acetyltransferase/O-succinyltransferase
MHAPLLSWQIDRPHESAPLGDLQLESGETIRDFQQSYVTHGCMDRAGTNVVLVCSAITGNHHRLDFLIGPGRALDPQECFIVAADPIGNGLSTSPSNSAAQPCMAFPRFTIRDMVMAQARLLRERLGARRIKAVVGASMGGMQALQWVVSAPLPTDAAVVMTAPARTSPWSVAVNEATRSCLMADPAWNGTEFTHRPDRGWQAWFWMQRALASRSPQSIELAFENAAALRSHVAASSQLWHDAAFDAHDFLYQSWAYDEHDVGTTPGVAASGNPLSGVSVPALFLAPGLDLYNPASGVRAAAAQMPRAQFAEIPSVHGHQSTHAVDTADTDFLNQKIREFLSLHRELKAWPATQAPPPR